MDGSLPTTIVDVFYCYPLSKFSQPPSFGEPHTTDRTYGYTSPAESSENLLNILYMNLREYSANLHESFHSQM